MRQKQKSKSMRLTPSPSRSPLSLAATLALLLLRRDAVVVVRANPKSRPYVAYRTSPFDQDDFVARRILADGAEQRGAGAEAAGGER